MFLESLKSKDTVTIFMGHSYNQAGIRMGAQTIGNNQAKRERQMGYTADGIDIQNAVLAVFSCSFGDGFNNITSSNGTAFASIVQGQEPGAHVTTYAPAVNAAAFGFAESLATGSWTTLTVTGELDIAVARGSAGIGSNPHPDIPEVNTGDRVLYRILPPPRTGR